MGYLAAVTLAIWIYLLFFRGGFWREFAVARPGSDSSVRSAPKGGAPGQSSLTPTVAIAAVIPARNEAAVIGKSIASLAGQRYPGRFHVFLVDDDSSDGTAGIAREAAGPEQLNIVQAEPLPKGWSGKLWAVSQGVQAAAAFEPDFLLLTDADIVHPPGALAGLAARAESYDLLSYMATLECRSPAERALVPAFVFFFLLLYPPRWIGNPRRSMAGAAGGCMLIRQSTLEAIGGIGAIRGALIDDCSLAAAVKRSGGRVWLGLNPETRSIRPYGTFAEIGRMVSRTAFTQLNHSALLLAGTVLGLVVAYLLPPILTVWGSQPAKGMAALAWLLMSIAYLPALRYYRRSWLGAPLLPLVAIFYLGATIHSAVAYWLGTGGKWKGRVQDARI